MKKTAFALAAGFLVINFSFLFSPLLFAQSSPDINSVYVDENGEEAKPPENNPETIAGYEPTVQPSAEDSTAPAATSQPRPRRQAQATTPAETPPTSVLSDNNAAASTQLPVASENVPTPGVNSETSSHYIRLAAAVLFLLGFGLLLQKIFPKPARH